MTPFEEQAITTFGAAAVDGLPGVATLGHQVLPLYINTLEAPASSPTPTVASPAPAPSLAVASPALAPTPTVASPVPASSLVTSPAPAFPALSINFSSSPSPHFSSSPSPPSSSLSPPILSSSMPSPSYIPTEKFTAAKMLGTVLKKGGGGHCSTNANCRAKGADDRGADSNDTGTNLAVRGYG
ncbi:uncharacterized protein LOC125775563 [Bactrocera dorsalis]|uniref:Uncharacterized protein LOC125775563 n=1 Tax=Bactrocera dorsalis TaxID=27457 RepID=A0ABM3IYV5_BACDO|nr:uncharacterized protein LOC125775563 [Bactrocera dorsalis]